MFAPLPADWAAPAGSLMGGLAPPASAMVRAAALPVPPSLHQVRPGPVVPDHQDPLIVAAAAEPETLSDSAPPAAAQERRQEAAGPEPGGAAQAGQYGEPTMGQAGGTGLRMAQASVAGSQPATGAQQLPTTGPSQSGAIVVSPAQVAAAAASGSGSGFRFTLAPIRWSGNLAATIAWTKTSDASSSTRNVQLGNIRGATYVWQPWFAQVSANLGFATGTESVSGSGAGTLQSNGGRDTTLTGGFSLSLFPSSRFPFFAALDRTDSRATGSFISNDFVTTRLSLRQDYTPQRAPFSFSGSYDRNIIDSNTTGRDTVDVLRGSMFWRGERQSATVDLSHAQNEGSNFNGNKFDNFNGRHNWQAAERLNFDSTANFTRSEIGLGSSGVLAAIQNRTTTFDAGTTANWQPETEKPLTVFGNLRLFHIENDLGDNNARAQTLTGGVGANYSLTPNLSVFGNGQLSSTSTNANSGLVGLLTAGAGYTSNVYNFGEYGYSWNALGSGAFESGLRDGTSSTLVGSIGQNLNRNFVLSERSNLSFSFAQSLGVVNASVVGNTISLGNSPNVAWTFRQSESFVTTVSAGASDTHFWGTNEGSFQQLSLQVNGNLFVSRYSTATAALTVQSNRQDTGNDLFDTGFQTSVYGTLGYQNMRVFGVAGLRYALLYSGNTLDLGARRLGNLEAPPQNVTHTLEQRLDYRIGRLDLQGLVRFARIEGVNNAFVFFIINRQFGSF